MFSMKTSFCNTIQVFLCGSRDEKEEEKKNLTNDKQPKKKGQRVMERHM